MTTNTFKRIQEFYAKCPGLNWAEDLAFYLDKGYVHITPEYALMGMRIGQGWFIYLAVGKDCFHHFKQLMPYHLPFIGWAREAKGRNTVVWHRTEDVFKAITLTTYEPNATGRTDSPFDSEILPEPMSARI